MLSKFALRGVHIKQTSEWDCGLACIAMVLFILFAKFNLQQIVRYADQTIDLADLMEIIQTQSKFYYIMLLI